ncbi:MAG TPA: glycosyltransferase family 4 protein [Chloroflexi bacterium]|nr:glycosyltransferase family 4 protein [Chloroflexota bacterium]
MTRRRLHVLYEWGDDLRPHGSAYIRLLRPLSHPAVQGALDVTFGRDDEGQPVDAVIVDRLWRPEMWLGDDAAMARARRLVEAAHARGARFLYALDDNLLEVHGPDAGANPQAAVVDYWLRAADGVLVTTEALRQRFAPLNPRIVVVPNALDERLLPGAVRPTSADDRVVIGYMGTLTHDEDLRMIAPALRTVCARHPGEVELQVVGVVERRETLNALDGLPLRMVSPFPEEGEYPLFIVWLTHRLRWDIALAPLVDTPFNACKSDLKHLDYAAMGAAGVYSRVPSYAGTVRHGETGWLAANDTASWVEALETLIARPALRHALARAAADYLYTERVLARRAGMLIGALEELLA